MFFDPNYLLFVMLPALLLSFGAQMLVRSAYSKWSQIRNSAGLTGAQVAQHLRPHRHPVALHHHVGVGPGLLRARGDVQPATVSGVAGGGVVLQDDAGEGDAEDQPGILLDPATGATTLLYEDQPGFSTASVPSTGLCFDALTR